MKKLMIAASAAVVGLAAFADVYNVKFTTTTLLDAVKKVKGEEVAYFKKGTVTVNGVFDDQTKKYFFWTGTGKTLEPIVNAVFEVTNDTDMDSEINGKNYAVNVGFYVGTATDDSGILQSYFVSGGIGKVNTLAGSDLVSANGSFGGTWYGFPAYGTWSWAKNAAATKNGIEAYVDQQGKQAGVTVADWNADNEKFQEAIDAWRSFDIVTEETAALIKEVAELTGLAQTLEQTVNDQERAIELKDEANFLLQTALDAANGQLADLGDTLEEVREQLAAADKTIEAKERANDTLKKLIAKLEEVVSEKEAEIADKDKTIAAQDRASATLKKLIAKLEEIVAENETKIADLEKQLETSDAKVAELKKALEQLNNSAEVVGLISGYLKDQIKQNQDIIDEATQWLEDLDNTLALYYEAVSPAYEQKLADDLAAAEADLVEKEADMDAKWDAWDAEVTKYNDYLDIKDALEDSGFDLYKTRNEQAQVDTRDNADLDIAAKQKEIDDAVTAYNDAIAKLEASSAYAAEYGLDYLVYYIENGVNDPLDATVYPADLPTLKGAQDAADLAAQGLANANTDLEAAQAALAAYTTADGEPDLAKWCEDNGYDKNTIAAQDAFKAAYKILQDDVATKEADVETAQQAADAADAALSNVQEILANIMKFRDEAKAAYAAGELDSYAQALADEAATLRDDTIRGLELEIQEIDTAAIKRIEELQALLDFARNQSVASITVLAAAQKDVVDAAEQVYNDANDLYWEAVTIRDNCQWDCDHIVDIVAMRKQNLKDLLELGLFPEIVTVDVDDPAQLESAIIKYYEKFEEYKAKAQRNVNAATELIDALAALD